jgi:hypothetical protein
MRSLNCYLFSGTAFMFFRSLPVRVYKVSCPLLQFGALGLADFMYPSSGLLTRLIEGMLKVRTGSIVSLSMTLGVVGMT